MMPRVRGVEATFWAIALASAGYLLFVTGQAQVFHGRAANLGAAAVTTANPSHAAPDQPLSGAVIGRVDIPQLKLSVAVVEDDTSASLLRGLGHIRGTAQLGGLGTVALAGHRDTFLRPLRGIVPGMEIRATSHSGQYRYVVDSTEIVMPQQVDVIAIQSRPELTLITCYPFNYVGAAPKRFVVHAHLVSVAPDVVSATR